MRYDTTPKKLEYVRNLFAKEDDRLAAVGNDLEPGAKKMQIGSDEGKLLAMFVRMINAKKIVELGTLCGYSSIWMAREMVAGGMLYAVEQDNRMFEVIENNYKACGVANKTRLCKGAALDVLPNLEQHGPFDLVFIDADKANYPKYLDWAEQNVRKGGLIIGDNTFLFDTVYEKQKPDSIGDNSWKAMQEFNRRLADNNKYTAMIIPTEEGMTVAVKNF